MGSQYHEPFDKINEESRGFTRALVSLKEEVEAVDWYNQRISAMEDDELKAILEHNRDEEIEHAVMILEWLRRNMGTKWDEEMRTYLFTEGSITNLESKEKEGSKSEDKGLTIGDLK